MSEPTQPSLSFLITKTALLIVRIYQKELPVLGITVPQSSVLRVLKQQGPLTQSVIGAAIYMDKATLSTTVRQLRDKKLIEASGIEEDARFILHSLTESGQEMAAHIQKIDQRVEARMQQLATPETVEISRLFLNTLLENLND